MTNRLAEAARFPSHNFWARNGFDSSNSVVVARRGRTLATLNPRAQEIKNDGNIVQVDFAPARLARAA
jgi:hypothetical protein